LILEDIEGRRRGRFICAGGEGQEKLSDFGYQAEGRQVVAGCWHWLFGNKDIIDGLQAVASRPFITAKATPGMEKEGFAKVAWLKLVAAPQVDHVGGETPANFRVVAAGEDHAIGQLGREAGPGQQAVVVASETVGGK
jgi:hypothetical protein